MFMKRSIWRKSCIVSGAVLALLLIWMVGSAVLRLANIDIIGGGDAPTLILLIRTHPAFLWTLLALAVFIGTGIVLLIRKSQDK